MMILFYFWLLQRNYFPKDDKVVVSSQMNAFQSSQFVFAYNELASYRENKILAALK